MASISHESGHDISVTLEDLCDACSGLHKSAWNLGSNHNQRSSIRRDFQTLETCRANAKLSKCRFCALIIANKGFSRDPDSKARNIVAHMRMHPFGLVHVEFIAAANGSKSTVAVLNLKRLTQEEERHGDFDFIFHPPRTNWSLQVVQQVRDWLSTCLDHHIGCAPSATRHSLPTRLLDVDPHHNMAPNYSCLEDLSVQSQPLVRLVATASLPSTTPYLTLSHCWGRHGPPLKLNRITEAIYFSAIPTDDITSPDAKVMADAILVTRSLGHRYIWVDSLCIRQDNELDKSMEITRMFQIYFGAVLNIAASSASNWASGMISESNAQEFLLPVTNRPAQSGSGSFSSSIAFPMSESPYGTLLSQRGWVFQETMLAPRVLHFTPREVWWECRYQSPGKDVVDQHSPYSLLWDIEPARHAWKDRFSLPFHGEKLSKIEACAQWERIVESYSDTRVTIPSDKLIALSAVARSFCSFSDLEPQDYAAGLWCPSLPRSLLWVATYPRGEVSTYRAPSWSWASVESKVEFYNSKEIATLIDIQEVSITRKTDDLFGEVISAYLRMRCFLCRAMRRRHLDGTFKFETQDGIVFTEVTDKSSHHFFKRNCHSLLTEHVSIIWDEKKYEASPKHVYFVPVRVNLLICKDCNEEEIYEVEGLVLCHIAERGQYIRKGTFTHRHLGNDPYDAGGRYWLSRLEDDSQFLERLHDGQYLIDIV